MPYIVSVRGSFFDSKRKIAEEIARLEELILTFGVEMGERHVEREEFITRRENDLRLLWEKRNNIIEREKRKQEPLSQLNFEISCNDKKIGPRIQHWDKQIENIDAILSELKDQLKDAQSKLIYQQTLLAGFGSPEESENGNEGRRVFSSNAAASAA